MYTNTSVQLPSENCHYDNNQHQKHQCSTIAPEGKGEELKMEEDVAVGVGMAVVFTEMAAIMFSAEALMELSNSSRVTKKHGTLKGINFVQ